MGCSVFKSEFYAGAAIRLATLQHKKGQPGRLLFATVSLFPRNRPLPPPMRGGGLDKCSVGGTGETIFFRRVTLEPQDAINWYRALGNGDDISPVPSVKEERNEKYDGIKLDVSGLIDDPAWPQLGLPVGDGLFAHLSGRSHPAPFIGNTPARIHRRFGSEEGFDSLLGDFKAVAFIARRLHVDLRLYKEYLGSVVLIAPDPILKQVDHFMVPAASDAGERIFYRFVPRPGESLEELQLTTFDEQAHLLTDFKTHNIPPDGILDFDKGACVGSYGYVVTHQQHGVLAYSPPYPFMRQVGFNIHPVSGSKIASVPTGESTGSPRMEYQIAQSSLIKTSSLVGDPAPVPNVNARIVIAALQREKLESAKQYGQRWFSDGSRIEAMRFIQNELRRAKSRIIIADPYISGLQIPQFLYAVNPETTSVTLLTSNLAFKSVKQQPSKVDDFSERLVQLEKDARVSANVRVLQSSILHDRFLVVDNTVWFLGNSLNTLGEKASLIVKIPNPDEVIAQLEVMLNQAIPFEDYKKRRSKRKSQSKDQSDAAS